MRFNKIIDQRQTSTKNVYILLLFFIVVDVECIYNRSNMSFAINVTKILDKLLTNYSKSLRPSHDSGDWFYPFLFFSYSINELIWILGKPTIVDTNIRINSLGPISNFEMVLIFINFVYLLITNFWCFIK